MAQFQQDLVLIRKARGPASKTLNKFVITSLTNSETSTDNGERATVTAITTTTVETMPQPPKNLCLLCGESATFSTGENLEMLHFGEMVETFCKHVQITYDAGIETENWIAFCIPCATFIQEFHEQQLLFQKVQNKMSTILGAIERVVVDAKILGNNSTQLQPLSSSSSFSASNPYMLRDTLFNNYRKNLQLKKSIHGNSNPIQSLVNQNLTNVGSDEISSTEPTCSTSNARNPQLFVGGRALSSTSNDFEDITSTDDESTPCSTTTTLKKNLRKNATNSNKKRKINK